MDWKGFLRPQPGVLLRFPWVGWVFFASVHVFTITVVAHIATGSIFRFRRAWQVSTTDTYLWLMPLGALWLLQPNVGLNRFGKRMTILLGFVLTFSAAIVEWNRHLSAFQLAVVLLALAIASEFGATLFFFSEVRGKP
ncbi:MAG: hypothetical protein LAP13_06760, partial [Acidobacteriia bacterium]|nr:hypothetical protein [Terriglobia bacterium]